LARGKVLGEVQEGEAKRESDERGRRRVSHSTKLLI
jgi:hypothetical protein